MKNIPEWALKWKAPGIEFQQRGNRIYAYRITSRYNPKKKRAQKITLEYLGVVTPKGIIKVRDTPKKYSVYEYGNVEFIASVSKDIIEFLKRHFDEWKEIFSIALLNVLYRTTIRTIKPLFEKTYLSRKFSDVSLSPKSVSNLYQTLGLKHAERLEFMREFIKRSEYLAIDLSFIFSESERIKWLEYGYNSMEIFHKQLNFLLLFSLDNKEPVYLRTLPGSVRDVSTIKRMIKEVPNNAKMVFIADKGFFSKENVQTIEKERIYYIIPLKRNLNIIRYPKSYEKFFKFRDRNIQYKDYRLGKRKLVVYLDVKLRAEEENTYLDLVSSEKREFSGFKRMKEKFGTLAILTNLEKDPEEIYSLYKQRCEIEKAIDVMKNVLEADKMYLRSEEHVRGYLFVMLVSLMLYYRILNALRKANLINVVSVKELLTHLSKIYIVEDFRGEEILSEIPKRSRELLEKLKLENILRKFENQ